jgi:hypothetical protein
MTGRAARAAARRDPEGSAEVAETELRSGEVGAVAEAIQEATATPRANELNADGEVEEPEELLCPITKVMMRDPVFVAGPAAARPSHYYLPQLDAVSPLKPMAVRRRWRRRRRRRRRRKERGGAG